MTYQRDNIVSQQKRLCDKYVLIKEKPSKSEQLLLSVDEI